MDDILDLLEDTMRSIVEDIEYKSYFNDYSVKVIDKSDAVRSVEDYMESLINEVRQM